MYFVCVQRPDQDHFSDPHHYQYFIHIRDIQIAFIIFLLVLRLLAEIDLRGQVDRAPAWSITSGDWFSDC